MSIEDAVTFFDRNGDRRVRCVSLPDAESLLGEDWPVLRPLLPTYRAGGAGHGVWKTSETCSGTHRSPSPSATRTCR